MYNIQMNTMIQGSTLVLFTVAMSNVSGFKAVADVYIAHHDSESQMTASAFRVVLAETVRFITAFHYQVC